QGRFVEYVDVALAECEVIAAQVGVQLGVEVAYAPWVQPALGVVYQVAGALFVAEEDEYFVGGFLNLRFATDPGYATTRCVWTEFDLAVYVAAWHFGYADFAYQVRGGCVACCAPAIRPAWHHEGATIDPQLGVGIGVLEGLGLWSRELVKGVD